MKTKRVLAIISFIAGFMLLSSSIGIAGQLQPMRQKTTPTTQVPTVTPREAIKPAAPSPTVKENQIPKQVVKIYSIAIQSIRLTSQCRLKIKLTNTGADLSTDQHKNSYIKVGQNLPISLVNFDPDGRLKKNGQTATFTENEPLTEDTNISIEVTLFNGIKTSKQKLLQPTCASLKITTRKEIQPTTPAPTVTPQKVAQPQPVTKTEIPAPMTPKSGDSPLGKKLNIPREPVPSPTLEIPSTPVKDQKALKTDFTRIAVTHPKADIAWAKKIAYTIQWNKFGQLSDTVSIVLKNCMGTAMHVIRNPASNSGSFRWTIPESIRAGTYTIMVKDAKSQVIGLSDEFRIVEELKALPVDLSARQVIVKKPEENKKYEPEATVSIEWETKLHQQILNTSNMMYFDIDLCDRNGSTKIYNIVDRQDYRELHLGNGRYRKSWNWHPSQSNESVRTGYYKIKVTPKFADKDPAGMPGLSGKIHLSRGLIEKTTKTLMPQIRDRRSRHRETTCRINLDNFPDFAESKPGFARVGFWHHKRIEQVSIVSSCYYYEAFIFRSQITFPIEELRKPGRIITKAELHLITEDNKIMVQGVTTCGGKLYYLNSPWLGRCIDTPGNEIASIENQRDFKIDVTGYAQDWFTGNKQNNGFVLGSKFESFRVPDSQISEHCVSWYRALLYLEMLEREY